MKIPNLHILPELGDGVGAVAVDVHGTGAAQ